jgi:hypothetical protein
MSNTLFAKGSVAALTLLAIGLATACGARPAIERTGGTAVVIAVPGGTASGVAWLDDKTLWLGLDADPTVQRPEVVPWLIDVAGAPAKRVPIDEHETCFLADYLSATRIDIDHAAFLRSCNPADRVEVGDFSVVEKSLVSISIDGRVVPLAALPDGATEIAWSPRVARGIVSAGSRICQGLGWIEGGSWTPMANAVPGTSASLGEDLLREGGDCAPLVLADAPAWSDDGSWIALAASPDAIGRGSGRLDTAWSIYTMASGGDGVPVELVTGVGHVQAVAISPDGSSVAFAGTVGGASGTFLVDRESHHVTRLGDRESQAMAFSSDGLRIAAILSRDDPSVRQPDLVVWSLASD